MHVCDLEISLVRLSVCLSIYLSVSLCVVHPNARHAEEMGAQ